MLILNNVQDTNNMLTIGWVMRAENTAAEKQISKFCSEWI